MKSHNYVHMLSMRCCARVDVCQVCFLSLSPADVFDAYREVNGVKNLL